MQLRMNCQAPPFWLSKTRLMLWLCGRGVWLSPGTATLLERTSCAGPVAHDVGGQLAHADDLPRVAVGDVGADEGRCRSGRPTTTDPVYASTSSRQFRSAWMPGVLARRIEVAAVRHRGGDDEQQDDDAADDVRLLAARRRGSGSGRRCDRRRGRGQGPLPRRRRWRLHRSGRRRGHRPGWRRRPGAADLARDRVAELLELGRRRLAVPAREIGGLQAAEFERNLDVEIDQRRDQRLALQGFGGLVADPARGRGGLRPEHDHAAGAIERFPRSRRRTGGPAGSSCPTRWSSPVPSRPAPRARHAACRRWNS